MNIHQCDRCNHQQLVDLHTIQVNDKTYELCYSCIEDFEHWANLPRETINNPNFPPSPVSGAMVPIEIKPTEGRIDLRFEGE